MRNSRPKGKVCPKSYTWLKDRTGISMKDILHILFFFLQEINPGMPNGGRVRYIKAIQAISIYFYGSLSCPGLINKSADITPLVPY